MSMLMAELGGQAEEECGEWKESRLAKPTNSWPIGEEDLQELGQEVQRWIHEEWWEEVVLKIEVEAEDWHDQVTKAKDTGILKGQEVEELLPQHPFEVHGLLREFAEVFGEIPHHKSVKKLVTMDLKLKPEWEGQPLKCRHYPLNASDVKRQDVQMKE